MVSCAQYDIMMDWIPTEEANVEGNRNTTAQTGNQEKDKINNIYDLIGGRYEWIAGTWSTGARMVRGGNHTVNNGNFVSYHFATNSYSDYGTRITLVW